MVDTSRYTTKQLLSWVDSPLIPSQGTQAYSAELTSRGYTRNVNGEWIPSQAPWVPTPDELGKSSGNSTTGETVPPIREYVSTQTPGVAAAAAQAASNSSAQAAPSSAAPNSAAPQSQAYLLSDSKSFVGRSFAPQHQALGATEEDDAFLRPRGAVLLR